MFHLTRKFFLFASSLLLLTACEGAGNKDAGESPQSRITEYVRQCKKLFEEYEACIKAIDASFSRSAVLFSNDIISCNEKMMPKNTALLKLLTAEEIVAAQERNQKFPSLIMGMVADCAGKTSFEEQRDCLADGIKSFSETLCAAP